MTNYSRTWSDWKLAEMRKQYKAIRNFRNEKKLWFAGQWATAAILIGCIVWTGFNSTI